MPQGPPGGVIGILGGVVAIGLIIGVAVTVFMVHRRQQKTRTETDNDLWVPSLCQGILQGGWTGGKIRCALLSAHEREKHFEKGQNTFWGQLMCPETEEHTAHMKLPPCHSLWETIICFPIGKIIKLQADFKKQVYFRWLLQIQSMIIIEAALIKQLPDCNAGCSEPISH